MIAKAHTRSQMKKRKIPTIFISYSWSDSKVVDDIEIAFQQLGIRVLRDIREIEYKGSIREYMRRVREVDYIILIISDAFLKSSNAMFEVLELLKDVEYKNKILPVVLDGAKVFRPEDRLKYIEHWKDSHSKLEGKLKGVSPTDAITIYKELKHIENVKNSIDEFLSVISDMNSPKLSELKRDNYKDIFNYIGVSDQELINKILSLRKHASEETMDIEIDKLESEYPDNSKVYFTKGYYAFERKQISKSNYYYRKSIALDPEFGATYYNLGFNLEVFDEDYNGAEEQYLKAIDLDPDSTRTYSNLGRLYTVILNRPTEGRKIFEKGLKVNPFDPTLHYNLALTLQRDFKEFDKAKFHYENAIKFKKNFTDAKHNYGILLWEEFGQYNNARQQFLEVLELEPESKNTLKQLGKLLEFEYKHINTAKIYYDRFIKIKPNTAKDHEFYAGFLITHYLSSHKDLARKHYEEACDLDPSCQSDNTEMRLYH